MKSINSLRYVITKFGKPNIIVKDFIYQNLQKLEKTPKFNSNNLFWLWLMLYV